MSDQKAKQGFRPAILVAVGLACLPLLAGVLCWKQWHQLGTYKAQLADLIGAEVAPADTQDDIAAADAAKAQMTERMSQLGLDIEIANKKFMPVNADSTRQMILGILDLAGRCGLGIDEVNRLGDDTRSVAEAVGLDENAIIRASTASDGVMALINRLSLNNVRRPVVQLRCHGSYQSVQRFFSELENLQWKATPVFFEIGQDRPNAAASPEMDADGSPARPAGDGDLLKVKMLLAL